MDPYELWMWLWLALVLASWVGALLYARWVDRRRPKRVMRDWATESKCRVTRRAFKTRAGLKS
jgi:hypothetical protein